MLKMVGQDIVSGAMGLVGTEPGKLYRMGSLNGVAEASGNPLTLKRCKNKPLRGLTIYGKSEQFTTTGKNLANGQDTNCYINSSLNICGVTNNDTGMVIDVSKLTHATISTRSIQDRYRVGCVNTVPTVGEPITCYNGIGKDGTKDSCTIDTTDYNYLIVNATKIEDIQVEKGSEATSYEPYTGGQPSPSPDYPQEIKSVVEPTVKITGKNLYDFGKYIGEYTLNGSNIKASVSKDGTFTVRGTTETYASVAIGNFRVDFPNGDYYVSDSGEKNIIIQAIGEKGAEFRTGETDTHKFINGKRSDLYIVALQAGTFNVTFRPMICKEKEELSTSEPYHEQTVTLPYTLNAIPVPSGGNYTDENGQQWIADYVDMAKGKLVRLVDSAKMDNTQSIVGKTEWLLAVPAEIGLAPEEITALKSLHTYAGVTNVSNDAGAWMKVVYDT